MTHKTSKLRTGLKTSFIILLLAAICLTVYTFVSERRVQSKISALKASGKFLTLAQLAGPPVPDEENGAIIYQQAFKLMKDPAVKKELRIIGDFVSVMHKIKSQQQWQDAEKAVTRCAKVITLVEEAQKQPKCRFPVDWSADHASSYTHYVSLRELARLLSASACISARNGDIEETARFFRLGFNLNSAIKNEPTIIAELVKATLIQITAQGMRDAGDGRRTGV